MGDCRGSIVVHMYVDFLPNVHGNLCTQNPYQKLKRQGTCDARTRTGPSLVSQCSNGTCELSLSLSLSRQTAHVVHGRAFHLSSGIMIGISDQGFGSGISDQGFRIREGTDSTGLGRHAARLDAGSSRQLSRS